jgi:Heterokaryon incompatibility protein Het-C
MNLKVHEKILRDALGDGNIMSSQALGWVITANKLCDLHQFAPERHFDNAPNREILCEHWKNGLKMYMDQAVDFSAPVHSSRLMPKDRKRAFQAFGAATHALADFYAHTNWVELGVAQGDYETLAPLFGDVCHVNDFPVGLQSGYFSLWYGIRGCPKAGPPIGYQYCHEQIAKDHPDKGHGADYIHTAGPTYHELAVLLASRATLQLWQTLHHRIVASCNTVTDAEAVFLELCWGKDRHMLA